jgi:hypothetical protein
MPQVGFEPMILAFQRAMTVHALDRAATVIINYYNFFIGSTAFVGSGRLFSLLIYSQSVGLLGRGISPSQGLHLYTGQHKQRKTHTHTKNP